MHVEIKDLHVAIVLSPICGPIHKRLCPMAKMLVQNTHNNGDHSVRWKKFKVMPTLVITTDAFICVSWLQVGTGSEACVNRSHTDVEICQRRKLIMQLKIVFRPFSTLYEHLEKIWMDFNEIFRSRTVYHDETLSWESSCRSVIRSSQE